MFVIALAPVMPVVLLLRVADTVPDDTDRPDPTITPPMVEVVAAGNRAAGSVPDVMFVATVVSVVALAARPETAVEAIAIAVELAAVSRPVPSTVNVPDDVAEP
jgi:hypothetical protein